MSVYGISWTSNLITLVNIKFFIYLTLLPYPNKANLSIEITR
jgi:hypothetical protein